jgi:RND family efflux transporter MFP subunit
VQLATVSTTQVNESSEYVATLRSLRSTQIQPQVDGHITRIFVTSGQRVAAGAPLMQIDPQRQAASVASQESTIAAREADLVYARQQAERMRDLFKERVVSKDELDRAESALKSAEAAVGSQRAQFREQRVQLGYFQVDAPTAGVVGDVPVRVGDRVTPDTTLTTIDQNQTLELLVPVPIERAPDLRTGLAVDVLDATGQVVARSTLSFVSPRAEAGTQSVLAKANIANPGGTLRSWQYVRARILWSSSPGITIPVLAVLRVANQNFAFVAEQDGGRLVARQRPIQVGQIVGDAYTVTGGLKPGERIVVSGVQKLIDGAPIQPQG